MLFEFWFADSSKLFHNCRRRGEVYPCNWCQSDLDVDEVPDNIDDEGPEEVEDVHGSVEVEDVHDSSFSNPSGGIVLRNEPWSDMLNVDPDATYASEFPEYTNIVHAHRLASNT
ncbi:hypothetical protein J1N35_022192 [Gossypium stocksii]|uniref:Uncharacterized protein n=1 Tax=Gossypium stocksii TaxID=47602 RepID=A0A9D4A0W8_9ROSI|nr:hypothetical protein J1N35_022192 [Gossypium stocksii]